MAISSHTWTLSRTPSPRAPERRRLSSWGGLRVLRSFLGALKVTYADIELGLDVDPERGSADSGDLEIDLPNLLVAVGEAAEERTTAVAVLIDEVQYFSETELGALIMAMHKIQQRQLPVVLLGAGLPILPGLAAVAELGPGPHRTGDVADTLAVKSRVSDPCGPT